MNVRKVVNRLIDAILITILILVVALIIILYRASPKDAVVEVGSSEDSWKKVSVELFSYDWDVTWLYESTDNININKLGTFEVMYLPKIPLGISKVQTVKVVDTTPPVAAIWIEDGTVYQSVEEAIKKIEVSAVDNYDGEISEYINVSYQKMRPNWYQVIYQYMDSSGNTTSISAQVNVVAGQIALTFDDGPSDLITPGVLEVLKENAIYATFFVTDPTNREDLIWAEFGNGNVIGYHGYSHSYSEVYSSLDSVMENFKKVEEMVTKITRSDSSKLVRFPGGSSNTVSMKYAEGIMTEAAQKVTEEGYVYFDWNVDAGDAGTAKTAEEIYNNVVGGVKPGRLNVVLMHDSSSKAETLKALPDIIKYFKDKDYIFVTLSKDTPPVHHQIAN